MSCPLCYHKDSVNHGELFCSRSGSSSNKDKIESGIRLFSTTGLERTDWHETRLSIRYIVNGSERFITPRKELVLQPGKFLVLNNGQQYRAEISAEHITHSLTVAFKSGFMEEIHRSLNESHQEMLDNPFYKSNVRFQFYETIYQDPVIEQTLHKIVKYMFKQSDCSNFADIYQNLLERLLMHTHQINRQIDNITNVKSSTRKEIYRRFCLANEFIEAYYDTDLTLAQLSKASSLSVPYLKRTFKEFYKITPYQLITQKRLQTAKELLVNTALPIFVIAQQVGFSDPSSFTRLFRQRFEYTPLDFRGNHKK